MSFQAYLDTIERKTGLTPRQLVDLAHEKGYDQPGVKAAVIVDWLKTDYDLGRGHAMALVHVITKGAKIDAKVWREVRAMYTRTQLKDGGWVYYNERGPASFSMTTCGVLGLTVVGQYGNAQELNDVFKKGMEAMINLRRGPPPKSEMYQLFATAELGRMLEQTEFQAGKKTWAWYREGGEALILGVEKRLVGQ